MWSGAKSRIASSNASSGSSAPARPGGFRPKFRELTEDRSKPLVGLLAGPVGGRCQPLEPARKRRGDDHDLVGGGDQVPHAEGQLLGSLSGLAGCD